MSPEYEERLSQALADVQKGQSQRAAAAKWGISASQVSRRLRYTTTRRAGQQLRQRLSQTQEESLRDWILAEERAGRALTRQLVLDFAHELLQAATPDTLEPPLNRKWLDRFLSRHRDLRLKTGRVVDSERVSANESEVLQDYFNRLGELINRYKFTAQNIYNMDETGVQETELRTGKVIGTT